MKVRIGSTKNDLRVAFAKGLFEKTAFGGDANAKADYNTKFIFEPGSEIEKKLSAAEEAVASEKWGAKAGDILKQIRAKGHGVVNDGNTQTSAGFEGMKYVSTRSTVRPTTVDRKGNVTTIEDGIIYSGCYVLADVEVWAQDNQFGKRINAQILGVQFVADGDSFGGGAQPSAPSDFAPLDAEGDEDDPFA